ncbi:hypothetical protein [Fodinicola feengrottensis]|uniref:hypothetical protein n=1 Tax=Fodinicola feengrottensis TaxID=435914 RepID=UPI0013D703F1|nr:hypothetical protein [Fodinicola feengrottensis]
MSSGPLLARETPAPVLPEQDHATMDAVESQATTLTVVVAIAVGGVALVLLVLALLRLVF